MRVFELIPHPLLLLNAPEGAIMSVPDDHQVPSGANDLNDVLHVSMSFILRLHADHQLLTFR